MSSATVMTPTDSANWRVLRADEVTIGSCVRYRIGRRRRALWVSTIRQRPTGGVVLEGTRARVRDGARLTTVRVAVLLAHESVEVLREAQS